VDNLVIWYGLAYAIANLVFGMFAIHFLHSFRDKSPDFIIWMFFILFTFPVWIVVGVRFVIMLFDLAVL